MAHHWSRPLRNSIAQLQRLWKFCDVLKLNDSPYVMCIFQLSFISIATFLDVYAPQMLTTYTESRVTKDKRYNTLWSTILDKHSRHQCNVKCILARTSAQTFGYLKTRVPDGIETGVTRVPVPCTMLTVMSQMQFVRSSVWKTALFISFQ